MELIQKYFPQLSPQQIDQLQQLLPLYEHWNQQINVISRKDIANLYQNHVLHSLAIARLYTFKPGHTIADVGTGGGFPGIPLAILFPEASFTLIDSTAKKLKVAETVANAVGLKNCNTQHGRIEQLTTRYHFVVSRAVTRLPVFISWVWKNIRPQTSKEQDNGVFYLKGGDFEDELAGHEKWAQVIPISQYFEEPFFDTKKIIYLPKK